MTSSVLPAPERQGGKFIFRLYTDEPEDCLQPVTLDRALDDIIAQGANENKALTLFNRGESFTTSVALYFPQKFVVRVEDDKRFGLYNVITGRRVLHSKERELLDATALRLNENFLWSARLADAPTERGAA